MCEIKICGLVEHKDIKWCVYKTKAVCPVVRSFERGALNLDLGLLVKETSLREE